ncbi:hypothetical protein TNIN_357291 [Trichonephila inaurata madagascariensis]|uniref:Uncharacterized protein n=1 Tax=Trichonephila inaurata madagascariensis TaxID=2747483 RepID=A0A8X6WXD2_9ARAC|nr:hypothetical protein TNIN_357291 [Trichonephila inaurata madagascariensis]
MRLSGSSHRIYRLLSLLFPASVYGFLQRHPSLLPQLRRSSGDLQETVGNRQKIKCKEKMETFSNRYSYSILLSTNFFCFTKGILFICVLYKFCNIKLFMKQLNGSNTSR